VDLCAGFSTHLVLVDGFVGFFFDSTHTISTPHIFLYSQLLSHSLHLLAAIFEQQGLCGKVAWLLGYISV
jgi:hypothetical protein